MDEIKQKIESLFLEIQKIRSNASVFKDELIKRTERPSQLSYPLDSVSQKVVENLTVYPVTVTLKNTEPATAANYSTFFIAERPYVVIAVTEVHGTAGTDAGTVTLQIERLQGTEALDSGDELLSSALSLKATANTVQYGTLKTTSLVQLQRGDRLALKDSGTLTAVANLTVTVYIQPA